MASSKAFVDYVMEQLGVLDTVTIRPMMGEYLLYLNGVLFGGIYDNRLLVKIVSENKEFGLCEDIPYNGAKPMYAVECIDDSAKLSEIVLATCRGLKKPSNKKA